MMKNPTIASPFERALHYLTKLDDYSKVSQYSFTAETFQLERVRNLLNSLKNPQNAFPVVHIAGTKGKGSTAVLLAQALQEAGYRTGLFTSPFLQSVCEQIQIGGQTIPEHDFSRLVERMKPFLALDHGITFFEAMTALAFLFFMENHVNIAIVETGLGGLTDATNVIEPLLSVITSISYDHGHILGDTIESITRHKAGIIKTGHPVLLGKQVFPQVPVLIKNAALRENSPFFYVDEMVRVSLVSHTLENQIFELFVKEKKYQQKWNGQYPLSLLGCHQSENAALAVLCLMKLGELGYEVTPEEVKRAWKNLNWPCRFEVIQKDPLVILDGAHNVDSMIKLREACNEYLKGQKKILVFGASMDKDIEGMIKEIGSEVEKIIFTTSGHPRAADPLMLVELGREIGIAGEYAVDMGTALKKAVDLTDEKRCAIVVTGSLHIAAAARKILLEDKQADE